MLLNKVVLSMVSPYLDQSNHVKLTGTCKRMQAIALEPLTRVEIPKSSRHHITDSWLHNIVQKCPNLRQLVLEGCYEVTDKGLEFVAKSCQQLQSLDVFSCQITDNGLNFVSERCTQLKSLILSCSYDVTDKGLEFVAKNCPHLLELVIGEADKVTNKGLKSVAKLTQLRSLTLHQYYNMSDKELLFLTECCKQLENLTILGRSRKVTDKGLGMIRNSGINVEL